MLYTKSVADGQTDVEPAIAVGDAGNADKVKLRAVPYPQAFCAATEIVALVNPVAGMLTVIDVPVLAVMIHPAGTFQK